MTYVINKPHKQVRNQIGIRIRDQLWNQLGIHFWIQIKNNLMNQLWDQLDDIIRAHKYGL